MAAPSECRVVVVANQHSPRWRGLAAETRPPGLQLELLSWQQVLQVAGDLGRLDALGRPALLRIGSPDDERCARALLQLAARAPGRLDDGSFAADAATRAYRAGELWPPRQFHDGLVTALSRMEQNLRALPWLSTWLDPATIIAMFDKVATRSRLADAGIPCTEGFEPSIAGGVTGMQAELSRRGWKRAYLKFRYGWGGCGLVYLELDRGRAISTVEDRDGYLANSRRLRWRPIPSLSPIMKFLIAQGATCERAIPLARIDGDPFDVRLLVIDERVAFSIARQSRVPITNLQLVGKRAPLERCRQRLGQRLWCDALASAVAAARLLAAPVVGADIAFHRDLRSYRILELNAFGDFFPRLRDERGKTVHGVLLEALARTCRDT